MHAALLTLLLPACGGAPQDSGGPIDVADSGRRLDSGDSAPPAEVDADGDGWPDWSTTLDPARADCDDADPGVTPERERYVPPGPFTRGREGTPNAEPVRTITLAAYCIDRWEVTNADFLELLELRESEGAPNADDDGAVLYDVDDNDDVYAERLQRSDAGVWTIEAGYERHPVVEVWWTAAQYYCARHGRTLPTEAQWEKAARGADDARRWPWGDDAPTCARANFVDAPLDAPLHDQPACVNDTMPVGSYASAASPYGAEELAGNVAEWVADWFDPDAYGDDPDIDPVGPAEGQVYDDGVGTFVARIARGGNYKLGPRDVEVSARFPEPFDATSNGLGFRCARALE
jgi:formylglycine-generating enzyme required for sulfatase activity